MLSLVLLAPFCTVGAVLHCLSSAHSPRRHRQKNFGFVTLLDLTALLINYLADNNAFT